MSSQPPPIRLFPGFGQALLLCVLVFGIQTGMAFPLGLADGLLHTNLLGHPASFAVINLVAFGAALGFGLNLGKRPASEVLPLRFIPFRVVPPMLVCIAGTIVLVSEMDNLVRWVLPVPEFMREMMGDMFGGNDHPLGLFILLVIVAPLTEEALFRGMILQGFLSRFGATKAILLCSLMFAGLHMNPYQFASATAVGLLTGWWLFRLRSLVPCLLGHAVFNLAAFGAPYLPWEIPGFTSGGPGEAATLQPFWFDAIGIALAILGLLWFHTQAPAAQPWRAVPPASPPFLSEGPPRLSSVPERPDAEGNLPPRL